jgi:excinuclease ABC subunit A
LTRFLNSENKRTQTLTNRSRAKLTSLILKGVRQNNLKNLDVEIPLGASVVITGPSGSGKSSLAFETVYAEGQRRYMQSLSTYARQFLEQFQAPDVDFIENIPPTIALEQINPVRNSRATVGTSTEIYDYLRLLFEKIGVEHCHGKPMERLTYQEIAERIWEKAREKSILLAFYKTMPRKRQQTDDILAELMRSGYSRLWVNGQVVTLESQPAVSGKQVAVLVDRIRLSGELDSILTRISEGLRSAMTLGGGVGQWFLENSDGSYGPAGDYTLQTRCADCGRMAAPRSAISFSFNSPLGACAECNGFGHILQVDPDLAIPNGNLSISKGAVDPFTKPSLKHWHKEMLLYCKKARIDTDVPWKELSQKHRSALFDGTDAFVGVKGVFKAMEKEKYKMRIRVFLSRYNSPFLCGSCDGKRLSSGALLVRVGGLNIAELCALSIEEMQKYFKQLELTKKEQEIASDILVQLSRRLDYLNTVGLGYLTLDRLSRTLSGGEYQRILLATQLSQGLTDTMYVLDEPSIGLHPKDTQRLLSVLNRLRELGNTVLVVEHDPEVIEWAEHVIDMGPGSGSLGGKIVFSGSRAEFLVAKSATAQAIHKWKQMAGAEQTQGVTKDHAQWLSLKGAAQNNLKKVNIDVPLKSLVSITGVSGSGKSTLIVDTLFQALTKIFTGRSEKIGKFASITGFENLTTVELVDQSPIGKTSRSNPVTFLKAYDEVRKLFSETPDARAGRFTPSDFSFNVPGGRCDRCEGEGRVRIDMVFMEDVFIPCPDCDGKRFKPKTLAVRFKGKNIHEVLQMTAEEAMDFFAGYTNLRAKLAILKEVGLGYLQLGQPGFTLSGGEAQRLKIAKELTGGPIKRSPTLFIFDEPTTGLHFNEIQKLIYVFRRLIASGHSVVVIEHNVQMICASNWVIDLGPDGGNCGGTVMDAGTPEELAQRRRSHTGVYLAEILSASS